MQARNALQAQTSPLGRARVKARLSARASHTDQAANAAAAGRAFFKPAPLALAIALAVGGAGYWPQVVQAQTTSSIQIAAQPLGSALNELARQAGLQLTANPDLLAGKTAPAVSGNLTAQQALNQLLAGSGLVGNVSGNAVVIRPAPQTSGQVDTLPEVVVTATPSEITEGTGSYTTRSTSAATGLNLSLRETPQSVTVLTRQRLDDQNLNSVGQALAQTPGISATAQNSAELGPSGGAEMYARGYRVNNYQVDGVATNSAAWGMNNGYGGVSSLDTEIYDSVAVVRGATGLLTGAGDPSASISLTRKRPTADFQASVAQSLGRWDQRRTTGDVGGPLNAAGSLRGRLVAVYNEGGSWLDRYEGDKSLVYGVLEADLADRTTLNLAIEHGRENANAIATSGFPRVFANDTPTPASRSINSATNWSDWHKKHTTISAALEHNFNEAWNAKLSYSRSQTDVKYKYGAPELPPSADGTSSIRLHRSNTENQVNVLDAKLSGRYALWGREHDLVAGVNASDVNVKYPLANDSRYSVCCVQVVGWDGSGYPEPDWSTFANNPSVTKTEQLGAYLATRLRATDDLSFIVGARLSNWKTRSHSLITGSVTDDRKESSVLTPYAGAIYDLTPQLSAYASYTEIFNPQSNRDLNGNILDPEEGKNYELGLKGEWLNGRLNASAAVFETRKDNLAIIDDWSALGPTGHVIARAENNTKGRGWELEIAGELARNWHLHGGYARIVTRDANGGLLNSNYAPKHSVKLFTTWKPAAVTGLTVGGGVQWQSEINYESYASNFSAARLALYRQKSYAVVSLLAQYRFNDHWNLSVNLNNVFDKSYRINPNSHSFGAPRNIHASLKYQF